jgi:hypothetical protein
MNTTVNTSKHFTVEKSIKQSCKEVKLMRDGIIPKNSLDMLFVDIEEWIAKL